MAVAAAAAGGGSGAWGISAQEYDFTAFHLSFSKQARIVKVYFFTFGIGRMRMCHKIIISSYILLASHACYS